MQTLITIKYDIIDIYFNIYFNNNYFVKCKVLFWCNSMKILIFFSFKNTISCYKKFLIYKKSKMNLLSHETMEVLVEFIWTIFAYIGIAVMIVWWIKAVYLLVYRGIVDHKIPMWKIRIKLGHYLVLALEFLVAKDILESIVNPSYQELITLWAIVTIRTVLSYFTNKEIAEVKEEMKADEEAAEAEEKRMAEKIKNVKTKKFAKK